MVQCDYKWAGFKSSGGDMCVFSCWLYSESCGLSLRLSVQLAGCTRREEALQHSLGLSHFKAPYVMFSSVANEKS